MVVTPTYHFIFENKTPKDVVLSVFTKGKLQEHFPIEAGKSYDKKIRCDHCSPLPFDENIDSLVIAFADGKSYIQYCNGQSIAMSDERTKCSFAKDFIMFYPTESSKIKPVNKTYQTMLIDLSVYELAK